MNQKPTFMFLFILPSPLYDNEDYEPAATATTDKQHTQDYDKSYDPTTKTIIIVIVIINNNGCNSI